MKLKLHTLIFLPLILLASCETSKLKKEAKLKAIAFFSALKESNENKLALIYPDFKKFDSYYKSDSSKFNWVSSKEDIITVSFHNRFTNGFGKVSERDITLFFKKGPTGELDIFDSKGLSSFDEKDEYLFGVNTGCISSADTTDQQIIKAIQKAKMVMMDKGLEIYNELKKDIQVVNWNWESGYGGYAHGNGIVRNNSNFSVPKLKYKITYKSSSGEMITTDDGYITYDIIEANESKSFTFYTSYVGNASRASIELQFDDELIFKYLSKKDWTGNECEEYFKNH